jgi:hypothetical protein
MVYGGMDGIITTFAIVCAASGANKDHSTIVTMVSRSQPTCTCALQDAFSCAAILFLMMSMIYGGYQNREWRI